MAGDWIKMRTNLDTDPRVAEMADILGIPELHVVGCLWKLWSWADEHTVDGNAVRVTKVTLDRYSGVSGFVDALRKVGWLDGRDGSITFTNFSEHNGQTAKTRALTAKRVAKCKSAGGGKSNAKVTIDALPREEKRREEVNKHKDRRDEPISAYLKDGEFRQLWDSFKEVALRNHNNAIDGVQEQFQLSDLERMPIDDAKEAIRFSISKGFKNCLTNGDHKRKVGRSATVASEGEAIWNK